MGDNVKMTSQTCNTLDEDKPRGLHSKGSGTSITSSAENISSQSSDERSRTNSPPSLYQQVLRQQASHLKNQKDRRRHTSKHHKLNLWELQKTLDRGDFIEGYLSIGPVSGQPGLGIVCSPVRIERSDGRMSYYAASH